MADLELVRFVESALRDGHPRDDIARALRQADWPEDQVRDALGRYAAVDFAIPVPRPQRYGTAREAFLYLVMFIALGVSATHLGILLFQLINVALPDPVAPDWAREWVGRAIRWSVSALIVAFPLYLWLSITTERARAANPERRTSRLRKWLIYLTLVIAAAVLLGDLVSLIYHFLDGELTLRFFLKILVVALIAGGIFVYYLGAAEDTETAKAGADDGG